MKLNKNTRDILQAGDILETPKTYNNPIKLKVLRVFKEYKKILITVECVTGPSWMIGRRVYALGISNYYGYEIIKSEV